MQQVCCRSLKSSTCRAANTQTQRLPFSLSHTCGSYCNFGLASRWNCCFFRQIPASLVYWGYESITIITKHCHSWEKVFQNDLFCHIKHETYSSSIKRNVKFTINKSMHIEIREIKHSMCVWKDLKKWGNGVGGHMTPTNASVVTLH